MSRRKKHIIDISSHLEIAQYLNKEFKWLYPNLDLDITTFKIEAYETYTPTTRIDIEALISRLERYIHINGDSIVNKSTLVKITKITRPTIDRLIRLGIIHNETEKWSNFRLLTTTNQIKEYYEKSKKK